MKTFLVGLLVGLGLAAVIGSGVGFLAIVNGWLPSRGDVESGRFETWAAHNALRAVLKREANQTSPLPADEKSLMSGAKVYAANCSYCHGTPKDPEPALAKGFNPPPTMFADGDMVTDDPEGHSHWKVEHGIKFTGMPSFSPMLSKDEIWQVTLFLKHMDKLPAPVDQFWKKM